MSSSINEMPSIYNTHLFFCTNDECSNTADDKDMMCYICAEPVPMCDPEGCPGCGREMWARLHGTSGYCGPCWQQRYGSDENECQMCGEMTAPGDSETSGWVCDECFQALDHHKNCNETRDMCYCYRAQRRITEATLTREPTAWSCTCNRETGLMCDVCSEEYKETCRGCGVNSHLWTDNTYCRKCYVERYGDEFPALPPSPPPATPVTPRHTSLESMRAEIAEIEARLLTNMTKRQKDDWVWILQNRRADLAEAEKEMWEQYDDDDLRKLDLQCRR
jgi:hypothetical protein